MDKKVLIVQDDKTNKLFFFNNFKENEFPSIDTFFNKINKAKNLDLREKNCICMITDKKTIRKRYNAFK